MEHVLSPISLLNTKSKNKKSPPIKGSYLKTLVYAAMAKQAKKL